MYQVMRPAGLLLTAVISMLAIGAFVVRVRAEDNVPPSTTRATTLTTAFTYQGKLAFNGVPVTDTCDLDFWLFDAPVGGGLIAPVTKLNIPVNGGVFTTTLDFGSLAHFNGQDRYLDIAVRCPAGVGSFVAIGRQAITPAPYALFAHSPAPGGGGGGGWSLTGNSGTNPSTNFIGTTDDVVFEIRANNTRVYRFEPNVTSPNVIGGYTFNTVASSVVGATISGGGSASLFNSVLDSFGTVGGGRSNLAGSLGEDHTNAMFATVGGGENNWAGGEWSTISGGQSNTASFKNATIGGGESNIASGLTSTISGGYNNISSNTDATIGGGANNTASLGASTVGGGSGNTASGDGSTIGGGYTNTASGTQATVGGGTTNIASNTDATVGGGANNTASGLTSTIGGGTTNTASGESATVGGGNSNNASDGFATIGGGDDNTASGDTSTVAGGWLNTASGTVAVVGGGFGNQATKARSTIAGGSDNIINGAGEDATIGGGYDNTVTADSATVAGGWTNTASGTAAFVGGGYGNTASGVDSMVVGGYNNTAGGNYSFAAGTRATADDFGAFVWGDGTDVSVNSPGSNTFSVRASGGIWLGTTNTPDIPAGRFLNTSTNAYLTTGGQFVNNSDVRMKRNFHDADSRDVLKTLVELPITTWSYLAEGESVRHMGPMAQDFYAAFGLGDSEKAIGTIDAQGVAFAAIQGLYATVQDENADLRAENADLEARIERLESAAGFTHGDDSSVPGWAWLAPVMAVGVAGVVVLRKVK